MNKEFEDWLCNNYTPLWRDYVDKDIYVPFSQMWGVYQLYFWETKRWWISIYPYTDKFGGKIRGFWDEGVYTCNFITNVPEQAQKQIVEAAFELYEEK